MATILSVGYVNFLMRSPEDAAQVIKLLGRGVMVKHQYAHDGNQEVWFPPEDDHGEGVLAMRSVKDSQVMPHDPKKVVEADCPPVGRRLKLLRQGGAR